MTDFSNTDRCITLTDNSGREVTFEFLDLINCDDEGYAVLLPPGSDGTIEILKVTGDSEYESEKDEETLQKVLKIIKEYHPELKFEEMDR